MGPYGTRVTPMAGSARGVPRAVLALCLALTMAGLAGMALIPSPANPMALTPASAAHAPDVIRALAQAPTVRVGDGTTDTWQVAPGAFVTVSLEVADVSNLGAATFRLDYDPAAVEPVACTKPSGATHDGFCNLDFSLGSLKANAIAAQGITGTRSLWQIRFEGVELRFQGSEAPLAGDSGQEGEEGISLAHLETGVGPTRRRSGRRHLR